jgi:aminoglycoside phosphotransferase (APT) family kinase protein
MTSDPARLRDLDAGFIRELVASQFPEWAHLPVRAVDRQGHDNRTFRLGDSLAVRAPSAARYAAAIAKEQVWLPRLAPRLPQPIPAPVALGRPGAGYPWPWSVNRWLEGAPALDDPSTANASDFAEDLADFLAALQAIDPEDGPIPSPDTFWRGGPLEVYDAETTAAIAGLGEAIEGASAKEVWAAALTASADVPPVWVHGDIAPGNLLVERGRLCAVIDFGQACVGDPACDLAIAWSYLEGPARAAFRRGLPLDAATWARGRGWCLWKALITLARSTTDSAQARLQTRIIGAVIADHRRG